MQVGWEVGNRAGHHAIFLLKWTLPECIHLDGIIAGKLSETFTLVLFSMRTVRIPVSGAQTLHQITGLSTKGHSWAARMIVASDTQRRDQPPAAGGPARGRSCLQGVWMVEDELVRWAGEGGIEPREFCLHEDRARDGAVWREGRPFVVVAARWRGCHARELALAGLLEQVPRAGGLNSTRLLLCSSRG